MAASSRVLNSKRTASLEFSESMGVISPLIHIGQFKIDAKEVMDDFHMDVNATMEDSEIIIANEFDTDVETVRELEQVCSPETLRCEREDEICSWDDIQEIPSDISLSTVNSWRAALQKRMLAGQQLILKSKYTQYSCMMESSLRKKRPKDENDTIECPETIITVAVNFPRSVRKFKHCAVNFNVLGSQKLTELRDVIPCSLDEQPVGRFTDNPDHPCDIKCKDLFTSAFIFIENIFYNDFKNPSNLDLSKHIIEWAENSNLEIPSNYKYKNMSDYTFDDLNLRLGCPYLYMHQGDCEHVLIIKDIRLLHPDDCHSRSAYPVAISRAKFKSIFCKVCNFFMASWVTRFDQLSDEDPSFFCDQCFRMLHYNRDGTKVAEFEAFPYISQEGLDY